MPTRKHDFTITEIKAGLFVFVSLAILALFLAAMLGLRVEETPKTFYAHFADTGGLNQGADVRFGGVKVGRVSVIEPAPDSQSLIRATLQVDPATPVNEESRASITQTTLTAEKHLAISTGTDEAALLENGANLESGSGGLFGALDAASGGIVELLDDVKVLVGVSDREGNPVMALGEGETIAELFVGLAEVLGDLKILLGVQDAEGNPTMTEEEQKTVAEIFTNLDDVIAGGGAVMDDIQGVIGENRADLREIVSKLPDIEDAAQNLLEEANALLTDNSESITGAIEELRSVLGSVSSTIEDTAARLDSLTSLLEHTLENLEALSGDTRYVLENNVPVIEDIILDARELMRYLKSFSRTMAEQPQAIIRGKSPTGRH